MADALFAASEMKLFKSNCLDGGISPATPGAGAWQAGLMLVGIGFLG